MSVERLPSGNYRATIMVDGDKYRLGTFELKAAAAATYSAAKAVAKTGTEFFLAWYEEFVSEPVTVPTFRDFAAQHQVKSNGRKVDQLLPKLNDVFGDVPLDKLKRSHVLKLRESLDGKAATTINNYLSVGSVIFKAAMQDSELCDVLTVNPFQGCRVKVEVMKTERISDEHHEALLAKAPLSEIGSMYVILSTLEATGLRVNNVLQLRRDHVDTKTGVIKIDGAEVKNGASLTIPLSDAMLAMLKNQIAMVDSRYLFPAQKDNGKPLSYMTFLKAWKRLHAEAKLSVAKIHGYRVRAATRAAEAGCSVPELMKLFGWKTPAQAIGYVRLDDQLAHNAMARIQAHEESLDSRGQFVEKEGHDVVM